MISNAAATIGLEDLISQLNATPEPIGEPPTDAVSIDAVVDQSVVTDNDAQTASAPETTPTEGTAPTKKARAKREPKVKAEKKPAAPKAVKSKKEKKAEQTVETENSAATGDASAADTPTGIQEAKTEESPKKQPQPRIFFGRNKIGRLEHKLGTDVNKFFLYSMQDAELEGDALAAKITENRTKFNALAVKVKDRSTRIIELLAGKSDRVNPILQHAMTLLSRDGKIVTGDKGNFMERLLKFYTPDAARAMSNSTLGALRALEVVIEGTEKHSWVPNENSVFLALLTNKLSLSFMDVEAAIAEEEEADRQRFAEREAQRAAAVKPEAPKREETKPSVETAPVQETPADDKSIASSIDAALKEPALM